MSSMRTIKRAAACGCLVIALCAWEIVGFGQAPAPRAPVFTEAQAAAGSAAYRQHCASCHGAQLEGLHLAPPLTGERFDRAWSGKTADTLIFQLRRMPPQQRPGQATLGDETYAAILAFLLQA